VCIPRRVCLTAIALFVLPLLQATAAGQTLPSFGFDSIPVPGVPRATAVFAGDVNGDGNADIISAYSGETISVLLGRGDGTFTQPILSAPFTGDVLVMAELNGDSKPDLIGFGTSSQTITSYVGSGDGHFTAATVISVGQFLTTAQALTVADFDGDGKMDLAIANPSTHSLEVRLSSGDGKFRPPSSVLTSLASTALVISGDFNNDGRADLLAADRSSVPPMLAFLAGNGDGSFAPAVTFAEDPTIMFQVTRMSGADFNGDGRLDLVIPNPFGCAIEVRLGKGDGTFGDEKMQPCSRSFSANGESPMLLADFTADGVPDFAVYGRTLNGYQIGLFPGSRDGTFQPVSTFPLDIAPTSFAVADFNRDGRLDLVVAAGFYAAPEILLGKAAPFLRLSIAADRVYYPDEPSAGFTIQVANASGSLPSAGQVTVELPVVDLLEVSAPGWSCGFVMPSDRCTLNESLAPGESYPPIHVAVSLSGFQNSSAEMSASLKGGGSGSTEAFGVASILPFGRTCLFGVGLPDTVSVGADGLQSYFDLFASSAYCPVSVEPTAPWVTVQNRNVLTVAANLTGAPRSAVLGFSSPAGWTRSIEIQQTGSDCVFNVDRDTVTFPANMDPGGVGFVGVITSPGCVWTSSSSAGWFTTSYGPSGTFIQPTSNTAPGNRSATAQIAGHAIGIFQAGTLDQRAVASLTYLALGSGWDTSLHFINAGASVLRATAEVYRDNGSPMELLVTETDGKTTAENFLVDQFFNPHASSNLTASGAGSILAQTGSIRYFHDPGLGAFLRFRWNVNGQEALVPMETRNATSYILPFDDTNGIATGVAIANIANQSATTVTATIRNNSGAIIWSEPFTMNAASETSFVLADRFAVTAGISGTIEFRTDQPGQISALGIRFPPSLHFSTIPVASDSDSGNGILPYLAVGDGWATSIELVNTGDQPSQAHLTLWGANGKPLTLPLHFGTTNTSASSVDQALAPHSRVVIESSGATGQGVTTGSALFTTDGNVSAFIRYRYNPWDQETIVPLENQNAPSYVVAFDHTNAAATGIAIANAIGTPASISAIVRDENGTQIDSAILDLAPNGQISFVLGDRFKSTLNQRGTIDFVKPPNGQIGVLGVRFPQGGAFTTIPVILP
jgi:hypothetical protein